MKKIEELKYDIERLNKQKIHGITLIALVITIIILIILAGISLNFILGDDSIISTAVYVREKTTIESIREKLELVKGSAYINGEGKTNISKYFEQLEKEKIEPYNVTNKEVLTELRGVVQVNQKYSYLIEFTEIGDLQITYEGKVGEENREIGEISVALSGENTQSQIPIVLTATITNSIEEVKNAKWILTQDETALGTEENNYTESTDSDTINLQFKDANTYYLHVLTTDTYGRKVETVKGPITIASVSHTHVGDTVNGGDCYTFQSETKTCTIKSSTKTLTYDSNYNELLGKKLGDCSWCGGWHGIVYQETTYTHQNCGASSSTYIHQYCKTHSQYSASRGQKLGSSHTYEEEGYYLSCGKEEGEIINYTITY